MAMEIFSHFNNNEAQLPPGFRFHPTDEELITYYLMKKVIDTGFTGRAIAEVDLNKCEPWELPLKAKMGEKEWYFFTLLDRKYPTGLRTNRATESGYWKATGKDREIYSPRTGSLVGMKKTLVFYKGRAPKGEKSNWVMHEYRLEGKLSYHCLSGSSKDEWVVCRVFQKSTGGGSAGGGSMGKKGRVVVEGSTHIDVGSPSSTSLPHLLDFPAFGGGGGCSGGMTDRESCCSYETESAREHVPCFSTMLGFGQPPPPAPQHPLTTVTSPAPSGLSLGFPGLGPLQQSLNMPFFFPSPSADHCPIGGSNTACGPAGEWEAEDQKLDRGRMMMGHTELDCMWTF